MPGIHSHQRCCDLASGEIARFAEVIAGADPATPLPTCGRWTLVDLVQHIGHIHPLGGRHGRRPLPRPAQPPQGRSAPPARPHDLARLAGRSPDLPDPGAASRRPRLVATDQPDHWTITRQPTTFTWTHRHPGRQGHPDPGAPDQPGPEPAPATTTTVTAHAATADLYLFLWGRRPSTDPRLVVTGDHALLTHWRRHAVIN